MIARARGRLNTTQLRRKAERGKYRGLGHAAGAVRLIAKRSIRKRKKASRPGTPPSTQTKRLPAAILYAVEPDRAVIGPVASIVGTAGEAHEHGGRYKRENYPQRPFMAPALDKARPRLPDNWAGVIH